MNKIYQKNILQTKNCSKRGFKRLNPISKTPAWFLLKESAAFTLIELLVVVLIIGILSAVALPQYEKAVEKSRCAEALTFFNSLKKAEDLFFLNNARYTRNLDYLDIQMPGIGRDSGAGQNNWTTDSFYYWVDAEGFGLNSKKFKARAIPNSEKYILYMEINNQDMIVWCGPYTTTVWPSRPASTEIPAICKSIAGNADGIISQS